jgi:transposase-like protein
LRYSTKFKEKLVAKALGPDTSIAGTARSAGISKATLYTWVQQARMGSVTKRRNKGGRPRKTGRWSPEDKLRIISEASALKDEELGAFMRHEGLHEADLEEMRAAALAGLEPKVVQRGPSREEKRIATLERELRRKEKALAEAAALLVLQKKFQALMEEEGDDTDDTSGDDS